MYMYLSSWFGLTKVSCQPIHGSDKIVGNKDVHESNSFFVIDKKIRFSLEKKMNRSHTFLFC